MAVYIPYDHWQEMRNDIQLLVNNISASRIEAFLQKHQALRYQPAGDAFSFDTNSQSPKTYAQVWQHKDSSSVVCLRREDGQLIISADDKTQVLVLYPGDRNGRLGAASLLWIQDPKEPNTNARAYMRTGDQNVFSVPENLDASDNFEVLKIAAAHHYRDTTRSDISIGSSDTPWQTALVCTALRHYLGIVSSEDHAVAERISNDLRTNPNTVSTLKSVAIRLVDALAYEAEVARRSQEAKVELANIASTVRGIYGKEITFQHAASQVSTPKYLGPEALTNRMWALDWLTRYSQVGNAPEALQYRDAGADGLLFTQCLIGRMIGATPEELLLSTYDFGPVYNRQNDKGFPITGTRIAKSGDAQPFLDDTMPTEGYGRLLGLTGTASGEIDFRFEPPQDGIVYITQDDVDVALALAFTGPEPVTPSFSLEEASKYDFFLLQKEWKPEWIGHTRLGKTLYATDYWMGNLIFSSHNFTFDKGAHPNFEEAAAALFKRLRHASVSDHTLRPLEIEWSWVTTEDKEHQCKINKVSMRDDGALINILNDGTRVRTENRGPAAVFTESYDDIAKLWPMYERLRQLTALIYSLSELKKRGFEPSDALARRIQDVEKAYTSRPTLQPKDRLVLPLWFG